MAMRSLRDLLIEPVRTILDGRPAADDRLLAWWQQRYVQPAAPNAYERAEELLGRWFELQGLEPQTIVWAPDPVAAGCLEQAAWFDGSHAVWPMADADWRNPDEAPRIRLEPVEAETGLRMRGPWRLASDLDACVEEAVANAVQDTSSGPWTWAAEELARQPSIGFREGGARNRFAPRRLLWRTTRVDHHGLILAEAAVVLGCLGRRRPRGLAGQAGRILIELYTLVDAVWHLPGCAVLVPRFARLGLRGFGLHSTVEPAVDYGVGLRRYALEGIFVPGMAIERPDSIPELLRFRALEPAQRIAIKRHYGVLRYLDERGRKTRDRDVRACAPGVDAPVLLRELCQDADGDLWLVAGDGSTSETHCIAVPPETRTCASAADYLADAWSDTKVVAES